MKHGYAVCHFFDATVDTRGLTGVYGVAAEILNRRKSGSSLLPRSFFRRACKRYAVGQHETRKALREMGWIAPIDNFPMTILVAAPSFRSYTVWRCLGYQVLKGATSYARHPNGDALFSNHQVVDMGLHDRGQDDETA